MIVGIDEAGRGSWAGPLVAAAVLITQPIHGLNDSKKLTSRQRTKIAELIRERAQIGVGVVDAKTIDQIGLTKATSKAMRDALNQIGSGWDEVIIDGNYNYLSDIEQTKTVVKADSSVPAVSAASIIAKVYRDQLMFGYANDYPEYCFDRHVGYGTKLHYQMLVEHGPSPLHRMSYKPLQSLQKAINV